MKRFGLIGKTLSYSFSNKYFEDKFNTEGISDCRYDLFELESISELEGLLKMEGLVGLNVTIPYKLDVLPFLDELDESAQKVGAVNTILVSEKISGFNTDYYGFRNSLEGWVPSGVKALVLGTGGASLAIKSVLADVNIEYSTVSRTQGDFTYSELTSEVVASHRLIINCTPLGTHPNVKEYPPIEYEGVGANHFFYDLVYNPEVTEFMRLGRQRGAKVKNGYNMLVGQAEKSWEIWSNYGV